MGNPLSRIEKILGIVEICTMVFYVIGAAAICALFILMFGDVAGRFLFNAPIRGATEVGEYLLVAIAFLSLGYAQLKGAHVNMEILMDFFPKKLRLGVEAVLLLLAMGFFGVMAVQIGARAYLDWKENILLSATAVRLPVWWKSMIGFTGCALLIVSFFVQIVRNLIQICRNQGEK